MVLKKDIADYYAKICLNFNLEKDLIKLFKFTNLNFKKDQKEKAYIFFLEGKYFEKNKIIKRQFYLIKNLSIVIKYLYQVTLIY